MLARRATVQGIAPPAQVNMRPSGRYALRAPEAPVGSILRVRVATMSGPSTRYVRKEAEAIFLDAAGEEPAFGEWEYAGPTECEVFMWARRVEEYADQADRLGAPSFAAAIRGLPRLERDALLCGVADVLRERQKPGKASAVLAYRWEGDE